MKKAGIAFRERVKSNGILQMVGIYDAFSALLASHYFDGIFCSGYSLAASTYGLPDIGFITWRDSVEFSRRIRHLLPNIHILTDVDDGFGDKVVAAHTVRCLERDGISAVMLEDQRRPRRCGHTEGKQLLSIKEYSDKLKHVRENTSEHIFIIARTDEQDPAEGIRRAVCYADAGADGIMIEAVGDLELVQRLREQVNCPIMVSQLNGGKSPNWTAQELEDAGASIVIYSTACLFAAQYAIDNYMKRMKNERRLPPKDTVAMADCNKILTMNTPPKNENGASYARGKQDL